MRPSEHVSRMPSTLDELAVRYHALEAVDKSDFQRMARILQSLWREQQGFPIGEHEGTHGSRPLGSRLLERDAEERLLNFLSDQIKAVVRREVLDPAKAKGKLFKKPRIFNDLLSSQPLCFNLFGELQCDLKLATKVLHALSAGRIHEVTGIEFEYSPGRGDPKYIGDRSAFDVLVTFATPAGGKGFVGIEVKYHENLLGEAATHKPLYDSNAERMGCFSPDSMACLQAKPLQQLWRDHLLAGAMRHIDRLDDGYFLLLYPQDNFHCTTALNRYTECLTSTDTFVSLTLETLVAELRRQTEAEWVTRVYDRYLDFGKVRKMLSA